jgi:hypothetical protein
MTLAARRLWVVCKTFNVLPNDPRVAELNFVQMDWIMWNLKQESDAINKAVHGDGGSGFQVTGSKDAGSLLASIPTVE